MPNDDRKTRYGQNAGTGANEPKQHERKEQRPDWEPRQSGDQTRDQAAREDEHLEPPIDPEERQKIR
jgi:hypothetical protein